MNYTDRCYWNHQGYGSSFWVRPDNFKRYNLFASVVLVGFYPVFVALFINFVVGKIWKNAFSFRY